MNHIISDQRGVRCYLDDLVVFSNDWEQHMQRLRELFRSLSSANLTINLLKREFGHARVTFLGHVVGQGQVSPIDIKMKAIVEYPVPENKKTLMRFLAMAGYYRRFCRNFSMVAAPLTDLLSTKHDFVWTSSCQKAFDVLKGLLADPSVLHLLDLT